MDALEKLKYFRSRPSCAWQSAQCARIFGAPGRLLATSVALSQRAAPAETEFESGSGGAQELGSSSVKAPGGRTDSPAPSFRLNASTRKPLAMPSVRLKRKRIVLAPPVTVCAGSASVTFNVEKPPPIP